jgi:hypothetical protein
VAIDRKSKFAFAELHEKATRAVAANFLRALIATVPYKIHTVLTDNGTHLTTPGNVCSMAQEIKECLAPRRSRLGARLAGLRRQRYRSSAHKAEASLDD